MPKFKLWEEVAVGLSLVLFLAAMISLAVTLGDPIDLLIKHVQASVQASAKSQPLGALPHHELTFIKETKSGYVIGLPTKTITVTHLEEPLFIYFFLLAKLASLPSTAFSKSFVRMCTDSSKLPACTTAFCARIKALSM